MAEVSLECMPELVEKSAQCMAVVAASCLEGQIGLAASSHSQHTVCKSKYISQNYVNSGYL